MDGIEKANHFSARLRAAILVFALAGAWPAGWCHAQSTEPGAIREQSLDTLKYHKFQKELLEKKEKALKAPGDAVQDETVVPEKPLPGKDGPRIRVERIEFEPPSAILSAGDLTSLREPVEGREVSIRELFVLVESINRLYKDRGIIAARAVLPPQKVEGGVVKVQLIEARVGGITVEDNSSTREGFVTRGVGIPVGELVRLADLERNLFFFNTINDIEVRAVLKPGSDFGTTDYVLKVTEPPRYQAVSFVDNAGRKEVGRERVGFTLVNRSLLGFRDSLTLGGFLGIGNSSTQSNFFDDLFGTRAAFAAYNFPLNRYGTRLTVNYDYSNIVIINGPTEPLNVTGRSENMGVTLSHPLWVRPGVQINGFAAWSGKESETDFDGATLIRQEVRTLSLGLEGQLSGGGHSLYTRQAFTDSYDELTGATSFVKYNGDVTFTSLHRWNIVSAFRARGQWADSAGLPPAEQFQVGGMSTVRGYREGFRIGDTGYFTSLEASFPVLPGDFGTGGNPFEQVLRGMVFVDHGAAFPARGPGQHVTQNDFLASAGAGVILNLWKKVTGKLVVGIPLIQKAGRDSRPDPRFHFILQYQIF